MKKYVAELLGTFILIFCAAGSASVNEITNGSLTLLGCALVSGLIIMSLIYALGNISGAHLNPAVTIGFALNKNFNWNLVLPYILCQSIGGIAAGMLLKFLLPGSLLLGSTLPVAGVMQSFILELITTFILMFVILHVATGSKEQGMYAGIAIGSVIVANILFTGPISGGSMNPVRSLAPAFATNNFNHLWIYMIAPVSGSILAVLCYRYFKEKK